MAEDEKKSIFRKEVVGRISSPEEYDHYLKVTSPGIWMILGAIVFLLIGCCIWAIYGRLTTTITVSVLSSENQLVCMIPSDKIEGIDPDKMQIKIAEEAYSMKDTGRAPMLIDSSTDLSIRLAGKLAEGTIVYILEVDGELPAGVYSGEIQVEEVSPISFILN